MKGEKGSLKNRMKEWKLRRQYQKKIKEKEKLEEKKLQSEREEHKEKSQFITIQTITKKGKVGLKMVFGILFGFLENINTDSNKKENQEKKTLEAPENIVKEVSNETLGFAEIQEIEENKNTITDKEIELIYFTNKPYENKYMVEVEQDNLDNNKAINKEIESENKFIIDEVKYITNEIDNTHQKLNKIIESDEDFRKKRKDIISVKEEVQSLKEHYYESITSKKNILNNLSDITEIDPYNIRINPKELNRILQQCDMELSKIKKENKRMNQENFVIDKQLEKIRTVIDENLKEQKKDIDELKKLFNHAIAQNKRSILVTGIHNFLSKTMNIGLSLLPVAICKNKLVGMLGSTVVLNNRLRNMRKIIRKENNNINYIAYKTIEKEIKNEQLCIEKTKEVLEDSMHQLQSLKQEFIMEFYYDMDRYPEADDIMTEFASIEYQITSKNIELEEMLETTQNIETKNKQKIKVMES